METGRKREKRVKLKHTEKADEIVKTGIKAFSPSNEF